VLVELRGDHLERQLRRPDLGRADLAEQVRERADVVLVAVREHHRPQLRPASREVGEVGEDEVDAELLVSREREPGVDDEQLAPRLEDGHVPPDLA
jgi:hypothetical protein